MKRENIPGLVLTAAMILLLFGVSEAAAQLSIQPAGPGIQISWPSGVVQADGGTRFPYFEVQQSSDLKKWYPIGERVHGNADLQELELNAPGEQAYQFYRLLAVEPREGSRVAAGGADVFGYGEAFAAELQWIGQISPEQFSAMFPSEAKYIPG